MTTTRTIDGVTYELPATTGAWRAVKRGDGTVTGFIEVFGAGKGRPMCSVPGASRFATVTWEEV